MKSSISDNNQIQNEYRSAEEYLLQIPMWTRKKNSLEDVEKFLEKLGRPDRQLSIIHVAGTNGKGSVCAFLTSMLKEAGYQVGTFVSPHLVEIRERFLLQGEMISKEDFVEGFFTVKAAAEQMMAEGYCRPTFFEFLFYMSLIIFRKQKPDYVILETGLGGRLDTTNVISHPVATVITSISLEHTEYLGDTISQIAGEKAGIIKAGVPVIFDAGNSEAVSVIVDRAEEQESPWFPVQRTDYFIEERDTCHMEVMSETMSGQGFSLNIPFAAGYQAVNALLAFRTLEVLKPAKCSLASMKSGIFHTKWPGRMERLAEDIYVDGAHNPHGIQVFTEAAAHIQTLTGKSMILVFAAVSDKNYESMIAHLCERLQLEAVIIPRLESERGAEPETLAQVFKEHGTSQVTVHSSVKEGLDAALLQRGKDRLLFCTGSLYAIGEIKKMWKERTEDQ